MAMTSAQDRPRLGWPSTALYGLGFMGQATRMQLLGAILLFYNQLVGLDAAAVSFAIFVALLVDALWDPIVGQISDNTRSRLGRRHPYIYGAIIPSAICFALVFMPPLGWSDDQLFFYLLALIVAARMLESLVEIPNASLLPELSANYDERTSLGSWRFLYTAVIGRALSVVLAFMVFLRGTKAQPYGQLNQAGYAPFAITVAIISVVVMLISARSTQRFVPYFHRVQQRRPTLREVGREVGIALGNRNFVALALSGLIFGIAVGLSGGLLSYFLTYYWELGSASLAQLGLWAIPGGFVGVVVAPYWSRMWGKKLGCLTVFYASILSTTVPIGARLLGIMPPNSSPWVLRILIIDSFITGMLATLGFIIVTSMLADVVEATQLKTGRRSEGLLFAADSLVRKLTTSFTALLPGILLKYVAFPMHARPGHVDPAILTHLATIYLPVVTVLYLCSTSVLMIYRIDRKQHEDNLERLAESATLAEEGDLDLNPHLEPDIATRPA